MKTIEFRRVGIIAGLAALSIIYTVLWIRMIGTPSQRTGSDFISAYTGGRVANQWGAGNVYDLDFQQSIQSEVVGFPLASGQVLMFNHPPYLVPLLALLMDGNYLASLVRYALLMIAIYAGTLAVAYRIVREEGWERGSAWLLLAGMATFFPLFVSLLNTQDTALLVLGGFLCFLGLHQDHDFLAGLGLALTTVRPHIALLLAIPFFFKRRRVFWGFILASAILVGIGLLSVGIAGLEAYSRILASAMGGEWFGINENAMVNLVGLLTRFFPGGGAFIRWVGWSIYAATLIALCLIWMRASKVGTQHFGLAIALAVFVAPHLHYHDLAILLIPLVGVILVLAQVKFFRPADGGLMLILLSLGLLLAGMVPALKFNFPCVIELALMITCLNIVIFHLKLGYRQPGEVAT